MILAADMLHMFHIALAAAGISCVVSMLIVITQGWHGRLSLDKDVTGVQKFHDRPVPRIGGVALLAGIFAAFIFGVSVYPHLVSPADADKIFMLLLAGMPAFLAGLIEDLTKKASVGSRLTATLISALLAYWLLGAYLPRLDVWGFDSLLQLLPLALAITAIAVAGVANAINIIDGFHGVAGSAVVILLAGMGFLAWQAGDAFVVRLALLGIGATLGFLLVNYPTGKLFMGDGGAYLLGFWVAEVAVLLVLRNPSINAWQVLAVCAYPITEVLYSIYRKKVMRKMSPGVPDRLHLHMLIYRRLVCRIIPRGGSRPWMRNAAVAWVIATWIALMTLVAVRVGNTVPAAVAVVLANAMLYMLVYTRLIRGRWQLPFRQPLAFDAAARLTMRKSR